MLTDLDTVLTCFPQRWNTCVGSEAQDELIEVFLRSLGFEKTRNKIKAVLDLANFLVEQC